jgi:putative ABC transport system permease protein
VIRVALRGVTERKLRAALTASAIVLGVAFVSGTYILTDTIRAAFSSVFTQAYRSADAVVTSKSAIGTNTYTGAGPETPSLSASLLTRLQALPQVALATGGISDQAQLVGHDGKVISRAGAPGLAFSHTAANARFSPLVLASGNWPSGADQVDIDAGTAGKSHFGVGQAIGVIARGPVQRFKIAGTVKFAGATSIGGATMAIFTMPTAQQLFHKQGGYDQINVERRPNVSDAALLGAIRPLLPPYGQVRTGQAQAQQTTRDTSAVLDIIEDFLLAFGGVALFVGSFVIANVLSITVAERTRELATLRTLGATRRQLLRSVLLEALVIGTLASVVGLLLGLGLAQGLNQLFVSFGIDLPQTATVFKTRTVAVSLLVGIVITMLAALRPALRSIRVPPIAAIREGAVLPPSRFAGFGTHAAIATISAAVALMLVGLLASGLSTAMRLLGMGLGAVVLFLGVAMLAPTLVPPLVSVLGQPASRFGGVAGKLARGNAARNPARTASTASTLMIGLALVTMVGVLAAGLRARFESALNQVFAANYAITATDNFSPISPASENAIRHVPGVEAVSGVRAARAKAAGSMINLTGVEPQASQVISIRWEAGSAHAPAGLGVTGALVTKDYASAKRLHVGSPISIETPSGTYIRQTLIAITNPPKGASPYGDVAISAARFDSVYPNPQNLYVLIKMHGGVTAANTRTLGAALNGYPDAKLQTKAQLTANQEQALNTLLNLLYVLLSLSIVVSLLGIVNTLVLTVFERTRELGMLRAVGMSRRQVRRMIRNESVITALLGAAFGIPLGVVFALMVGATIKYAAFTLPVGTLAVYLVAAIVIGIVAAILPARRAGRLNVLQALQYE